MVVSDAADAKRAVNWEVLPQESIRLSEMFNAKGSFEHAECPLNPSLYSRKVQDTSFINRGLGYRAMGFVGGGGHEGIGITCVLAERLTREHIFEALKARRCYATTGARIMLDILVGDAIMGGRVMASKKDYKIDINVQRTADLASVELVTNQRVVTIPHKGSRCNVPIALRSGFRYVYLRVLQVDGEAAWSSPVFVGR
jgi:hypothetical protein